MLGKFGHQKLCELYFFGLVSIDSQRLRRDLSIPQQLYFRDYCLYFGSLDNLLGEFVIRNYPDKD